MTPQQLRRDAWDTFTLMCSVERDKYLRRYPRSRACGLHHNKAFQKLLDAHRIERHDTLELARLLEAPPGHGGV